VTSKVAKDELNAINATGESVLGLPPFIGKPVIVLIAAQSMKDTSALADDANEKRKDLARLYPGAKQIWVESGHGIPLENPDSIISAIREVLLPKQSESTHQTRFDKEAQHGRAKAARRLA
jgi:pimeloyl-ACP methyl ester carboxylesterase